MPKSDRTIQNELTAHLRNLQNYEKTLEETRNNKQKSSYEFVEKHRLWPDGAEVTFTNTPESSEPKTVTVESVYFYGDNIQYQFSDGTFANHTELEGEGYQWE